MSTKEYHKQKSQEHYQKYKEAYKKRVAERRKAALQFFSLIKKECCRCGEKEYICLALHHTDPSIKEFDFGSNMSRSIERLKKEVDKCEVVCHNCHAKIHGNIIPFIKD